MVQFTDSLLGVGPWLLVLWICYCRSVDWQIEAYSANVRTEFEVTEERLGCYRPEEHIDNPKDYADNKDAREYDKRLRPPVRPIELEIDPKTGMKVSGDDAECCSTTNIFVKRTTLPLTEIGLQVLVISDLALHVVFIMDGRTPMVQVGPVARRPIFVRR